MTGAIKSQTIQEQTNQGLMNISAILHAAERTRGRELSHALKRLVMGEAPRSRNLQFALFACGLVFIFGIYPLTVLWPSGWSWHTGQSEYLQMIIGIYATLGVFLVVAAKDPSQHLSLISFTIWSSIVHGLIMATQSLVNSEHLGHLCGDVLALFLVAGLLGLLCPAALRIGFLVKMVGSDVESRPYSR